MTSPPKESGPEPLRHAFLVGVGLLATSVITIIAVIILTASAAGQSGDGFAYSLGYSLPPACLISLATWAGLHYAIKPRVTKIASTQGLLILIAAATLSGAAAREGFASRAQRTESQVNALDDEFIRLRNEEAAQLARQVAAIDQLSFTDVHDVRDVEERLNTIRACIHALQDYSPRVHMLIAQERAKLVGTAESTIARRNALASFEQGFDDSPGHAIIALQLQRLQKIEGALTLLQAQPAAWANEGGTIVFTDDSLLDQITALIREASALRDQASAASARAAPGSPTPAGSAPPPPL